MHVVYLYLLADIPHFQEVIVMASSCESCGYRSSEVCGNRELLLILKSSLHNWNSIDSFIVYVFLSFFSFVIRSFLSIEIVVPCDQLKPGGPIPEKAKRITLHVQNILDLSRDVIKVCVILFM